MSGLRQKVNSFGQNLGQHCQKIVYKYLKGGIPCSKMRNPEI